MTSKPLASDTAKPRWMACHVRATIDYLGRHYSVRIGQIESRRLLLTPLAPLSIPADAILIVTSAEFGRIEARLASMSDLEIVVEFHEPNAAIDHLLSLGDL